MAVLVVCVSVSCTDFLNQVPDDRLTLNEAFSTRTSVEQFLANTYSEIPDEFDQRFVGYGGRPNPGPWTGASDEAEYVWSFVFSNSMNIGAWDANSGLINSLWSNYYRGIRSASFFLQNVDQCLECGPELITRYKAEARALRAIYYYYLMRSYGPVVVIGDEPIDPDAIYEDLQLPRTPFDEGVAYVVSELELAAQNLPVTPPNNNYHGRITRGVALGIKSNLLLLAASPLFNGNPDYAAMTNTDGVPLINQQYNEGKWEAAANAARDFIGQLVPNTYRLYRKNDSEGNFSPYLSTRDVMLDDWNDEIIFARVGNFVNNRQYELTPFHSGAASENRGSGGLAATQNMVDAYFTANGRTIDDPQSGYQETGFSDFQAPYDTAERETYNQWVNREPRFYVGITYNNSRWLNTSPNEIVTETWYGGNSGRNIGGNDYSPTGYIVRKNMHIGAWNSGNRTLVLMRLAEIYLNYVEALNEYSPDHPDILEYLNRIRNRAGIPEYGSAELGAPATQAEMREAIRRERRVELAFENSRFFDVRRWKIAAETDNGLIYGLDINAQNEQDFYNVVPFENRIFDQRHYLFPIPQSEININVELVQNTGW